MRSQYTPNFKPLPADYQEIVSTLKKHIEFSEKKIVDFEKRHYNRVREKAIIYCLCHAVDIAKGSLNVAMEELPDSLTTLCRANLETLIWARYISISEENAQAFTNHALNEFKRLGRNALRAGHAQVIDEQTREDLTKKYLESAVFESIPQGVKIKDAAKAGGLERVYTSVYGFISMPAHGRALGLEDVFQDPYYPAISATLGALQGVELIAINWIVHRKETPREILIQMLGI